MKEKIHLYYLTLEGISSTVFESQVLSLLKRLDKKDIKTRLLIGQKLKSRIPLLKLLSLWLKKSVSFVFLEKEINHQKIAQKLIHSIKSDKAIIHCRNVEAAYVGLLIREISKKNVQIIYDVRGYVEGEKSFFKEPKREKLFKELNSELFKSNIYFNFVSQELYEIYRSEYKISKGKVIFCNSAYDDAIFHLSEGNNTPKSEKIKVLFVGGNQLYQKATEIIRIIEKRQDIELTVVTPKKINITLREKNIKLLINLSQDQINNLASDFDYGIIYRDSQRFNNVATPTKVSEYFGKGLRIIAINSAGSYTSLINNNKLFGHVVKSENDLLSLNLDKTDFEQKKRINSFAIKNLSLSKNVKKYMDLYKRINEDF